MMLLNKYHKQQTHQSLIVPSEWLNGKFLSLADIQSIIVLQTHFIATTENVFGYYFLR